MATAVIDGIATRYEVVGAGAPLLMFSPGGFDATLEKWTHARHLRAGQAARLTLRRQYRCILFDRRESGQSGGRVERVTWTHYVGAGQGAARPSPHRAGAPDGRLHGLRSGRRRSRSRIRKPCAAWCCTGRSAARDTASTASNASPSISRSSSEHGLDAVVALAQERRQAVQRRAARRTVGDGDPERPRFRRGVTRSRTSIATSSTSPAWGARCSIATPHRAPKAEDLLRLDVPALVVPGHDASHATSAARYLEECLPGARVLGCSGRRAQTEDSGRARLLDSLLAHDDDCPPPRSGIRP